VEACWVLARRLWGRGNGYFLGTFEEFFGKMAKSFRKITFFPTIFSLGTQRSLMPIMIICLVIVLFSLYYVAARQKKLLERKRINWVYLFFFLIVIAGYIYLFLSRAYLSENLLFAALYNVLGFLFVVHIYFFFALLITHPFSKFITGKRGKAVNSVCFLAALALVSWGVYHSYSVKVTETVIKVKGLKAPLTIMHAPDLHLGPSRGETFLKEVVTLINEYKPNIVIYNGDVADGNISLTPEIFSLFKSVQVPQYFTTGNHEFYVDTNRELALIRGAGIRILRNENVITEGINLVGLEYMNADKEANDAHRVNNLTIEEELPKIKRDPGYPSILIHHSPVGMNYVIKEKIPVMLIGHTHGGQFFPGNFLIWLRFPKYKGRYDFDGLTLLVSQGAGTFGPPVRLGTFAEIQFITLEPEN
jgi:predicted MPP superfamily phosphohydrolase